VEPRGAGTATRTVGPTGSEPVSSQPGSQPSGRPAITASPDHGSPTATFTVRGSHWPAACAGQVNIVLDDSFYSPNPGETNAAGQFSVPFYPTTTRERQLSPGPHTVTGSCADGRYESAPVTYLVTG